MNLLIILLNSFALRLVSRINIQLDSNPHMIDRLQATKRVQVEVRWVLAYTGIPGNEKADVAAKEAAGWRANEPISAGNRAASPLNVV
jgi:ribonuclease HI